jgi:ferredoxin-NADP reductase
MTATEVMDVATAKLVPTLPRIPWREVEILEIVTETERVRSLVLRVPDWPGHVAGQHVDVRLTAEDGYRAERSYSIASPPERAEVVLTIERVEDGEVSPYLAGEARPGDRFELRGPIGSYFTWSASLPGPLQLVAGGSGIVPLMAMLRHRAQHCPRTPARLLFSSRTLDSIIYRTELERLVREDAELAVVHTLTREVPPGWSGPRRRVDVDMLRDHVVPRHQRPHIYICGPTPFVESVADAFLTLGNDPAAIRTERFGPTGGQG